MKYQKIKDIFGNINETMIKRIDNNGVEWFIPFAEGNSDYQKYLDWLAEGNEPEEAE